MGKRSERPILIALGFNNLGLNKKSYFRGNPYTRSFVKIGLVLGNKKVTFYRRKKATRQWEDEDLRSARSLLQLAESKGRFLSM